MPTVSLRPAFAMFQLSPSVEATSAAPERALPEPMTPLLVRGTTCASATWDREPAF